MPQHAVKYHGMDVHMMHPMQDICTLSVEFHMMLHMSSGQVYHILHDRTDHVERSSFHIQDVHMELHAHMMPRMHSVWDEILEEVPYCDDHLACAFRDTSQHPVNVLMCMKSKGVSFSE